MEFMAEPVKTLETMEDVRAWINGPVIELDWHEKYRVRSNWLVSIIDEVTASGEFPYNSAIKRIAEERLGFPKKPDEYYANEGSPLSLLIYNAQRFRGSDNLRESGFEPLTQDLIDRALREEKSIEISGHNMIGGAVTQKFKVRTIQGKNYLMEPRKRKYCVPPKCQPAKLV